MRMLSAIFLVLFFASCNHVEKVSVVPSQALQSTTVQVLFSPDDHPTEELLTMLNAARLKIYAAVYMLTDKRIAQALCEAKRRGVDVQIVLDQSSMDGVGGKGLFLKQNNIDVFVFKPPMSKNVRYGYRARNKHVHNDHEAKVSTKKNHFWHGAIMHNKFALIDEKVWTGSFNWTISANQKNEENVIIVDDPKACEIYNKRFAELIKRCERVSGSNRSIDSLTPDQYHEHSRSWFSDYIRRIRAKFVDFFIMLGLFRPTVSYEFKTAGYLFTPHQEHAIIIA